MSFASPQHVIALSSHCAAFPTHEVASLTRDRTIAHPRGAIRVFHIALTFTRRPIASPTKRLPGIVERLGSSWRLDRLIAASVAFCRPPHRDRTWSACFCSRCLGSTRDRVVVAACSLSQRRSRFDNETSRVRVGLLRIGSAPRCIPPLAPYISKTSPTPKCSHRCVMRTSCATS